MYPGLSDEMKQQFVAFMSALDTVSTDALRLATINAGEQKMLKKAPAAYVDGEWPAESDFFDFSKVKTTGPKVYHFLVADDAECYVESAKKVLADLPTTAGEYDYSCETSHEWFLARGAGQKKWLKDMVIVLGAKALAVGTMAAAIAIALF